MIGSHSLAVSSDAIRRSIVSSGTRLPERIAPSASRPEEFRDLSNKKQKEGGLQVLINWDG